MQMVYGTHGDIPKIVLAPSDVEDAFYTTIEAFNLADTYQLPVILLSDLQMSLGKQTSRPFDQSKVEISRGKTLVTDVEAHDNEYFHRYADTEDGVSPRPVPGLKNGIHHVTGVEHNPDGTPNENAENRKLQMDKRMRKMSNELMKEPFKVHGDVESDVVIISILSVNGVVQEAAGRLNENITTISLKQIYPMPIEQLKPYLEAAKKIIVIEHNYSAQLMNILKMNYGGHDKMASILKYDGTPFKPYEVVEEIRNILE